MPTWQVNLFGNFSLRSPSGDEVTLYSRKVQGLLGMLVASSPGGLSRQEITDGLWPQNSNPQNLRQTVYYLRQAIGVANVDFGPDHCRLTETFRFKSDLEDPSTRTSDYFMPGHLTRWFDEMRTEFELAKSGPAFVTLVESFA